MWAGATADHFDASISGTHNATNTAVSCRPCYLPPCVAALPWPVHAPSAGSGACERRVELAVAGRVARAVRIHFDGGVVITVSIANNKIKTVRHPTMSHLMLSQKRMRGTERPPGRAVRESLTIRHAFGTVCGSPLPPAYQPLRGPGCVHTRTDHQRHNYNPPPIATLSPIHPLPSPQIPPSPHPDPPPS